MKGNFIHLTANMSGRYDVFLTVEGHEIATLYQKHKDDTLSIEIKKYNPKRSLNANSYYWILVGKLAKALKLSNAEVHNMMLRDYGALELIDEQAVYLVLPDTEEVEQKTLKSETYHVRPTSQVKVGKDGKMYRTYMMLKGSHEFDSAEMSRLIHGIVETCNEQGIETANPNDIEMMIYLYGAKKNETNNR